MPPKPKILKEMILNTVMEITREAGFQAVNARSIAARLQCSTRPIFTCYENMDELKKEFLAFAYEYFEQYVIDFCNSAQSAKVSPYLTFPLSYIEFAREETHLFRLLFIDDMDLKMTEAEDFYKEIDNEKRAEDFSKTIGIELEHAKTIFLDLFLYAHGMAVLAATKKFSLDRAATEKMLMNVLLAFIKQERPDWQMTL